MNNPINISFVIIIIGVINKKNNNNGCHAEIAADKKYNGFMLYEEITIYFDFKYYLRRS